MSYLFAHNINMPNIYVFYLLCLNDNLDNSLVLSSFLFYHKSEFAIGFLILENIQKHTSFTFLPCLVKHMNIY